MALSRSSVALGWDGGQTQYLSDTLLLKRGALSKWRRGKVCPEEGKGERHDPGAVLLHQHQAQTFCSSCVTFHLETTVIS